MDTNVISELVRSAPDSNLIRWLTRQSASLIHLSVISLGELAPGLARMPSGSRREQLEDWLENDVRAQFSGRLLEFGEPQAMAWGRLRARTERQGSTRSAVDLQIAATAEVAGLSLATRNIRDFENLGITLVDPWTAR